ncbi:MAG: nucleotidyltransferase domain-containing protein [Deltaproteobacteria bacterium]|nr:nucleotidyltransferase domain-containing protein [Deltaproteobacteria bacterium]
MYIVDLKRFERALEEQGYATIGALAKDLGVHRNTVHYYLSGHGVFPEAFEKLLSRLRLRPDEILIQTEDSHLASLEAISTLISQLQAEYPTTAFVLFGSRARQKSQKYSDWDIGVYDEKDIPHDIYRKMHQIKSDYEESLPYKIDIANLNRADSDFLKEASKGWMFLGGSLKSWLDLNKKQIFKTKKSVKKESLPSP